MRYSPFHLEELYNQCEGSYTKSLSSGYLEAFSLQNFCDLFCSEDEKIEIQNLLFNTKLDYANQYGYKPTLDKLAAKHNTQAENFLLSSGASEGIWLVFSTLFNPGDTIIVQDPIYQSLYQIAQDQGINVIPWSSDYDFSYKDQITKLAGLITPDTKALVINNPNNPLGTAFNTDQLTEIINLLKDHQIKLISDEVFLDASLKPLTSAAELYEHAISINDLSKSYSMPGLRLGWIYSQDAETLSKLSSQKNYSSLRNNILAEKLAEKVLEKANQIQEYNISKIQKHIENFQRIDQAALFFKLPIALENLSGACMLASAKEGINIQSMHANLLQQGIFIAPGSSFGEAYTNRFRLGFYRDIAAILENSDFKVTI